MAPMLSFALITFALTHLAAVASPGPSFIVVVRAALSKSVGNGIAVAFGLGIGTLVWAAGAWFGLNLLFNTFPWLFTVLRFAGAAYLAYLAFNIWKHASQPLNIPSANQSVSPSIPSDIVRGFLTQMANPKVAVFFGSIFVAILPPDLEANVVPVVFAIVFANEFLWYALVSLLMGAISVRTFYEKAKPTIDRVTGTFLGLLAAKIASGQ